MDIKHFFKILIQRSRMSVYPKLVSGERFRQKFPIEITDVESQLVQSQIDSQNSSPFRNTPERQAEERSKRLHRVFGTNAHHVNFDDEEEYDYQEYRDIIIGKQLDITVI